MHRVSCAPLLYWHSARCCLEIPDSALATQQLLSKNRCGGGLAVSELIVWRPANWWSGGQWADGLEVNELIVWRSAS